MKKLITTILALLLIVSLCACDGGKKNKPATDSDLTWEEIEALAEKELEKENG